MIFVLGSGSSIDRFELDISKTTETTIFTKRETDVDDISAVREGFPEGIFGQLK